MEDGLFVSINPNLQDQRLAMANQFDGMSDKAFSYPEFEKVRTELITTIQQSLTYTDKEFLISIKSLEPKWEIYNFEQFPAVQWKLQNLAKLKETNLKKYHNQLEALKAHLQSTN